METVNRFASVHRLSAVCAATMTLVMTQACDGSARQAEQLSVNREVLVRGSTGRVSAITRDADGNFVVAGARGLAWAAALSAQGEILWTFEQSSDGTPVTAHQAEYHGAVSLRNGTSLLCGHARTSTGQVGLMTVLDLRGRPVDDRRLLPNDDRKFYFSSLHQCMVWNDGILAIGTTTDGTHGFAWLMRLNGDGVKEWETVNPDLAGSFAVETPTHELLLATMAGRSKPGETTLFRVGQNAEILSSRSIRSSGYALLRSTRPGSVGTVVLYEDKPMVHTLNEHLEDMEVPRTIPPVYMQQSGALGRGYVLPDNSLALFGYVQKGGGAFTAPYTAAVAHVGGAGRDLIHAFAPLYNSVAVIDAIRISDTQFVTVREVIADKPSDSGIMLSWITF